jgi:hypothetical protein
VGIGTDMSQRWEERLDQGWGGVIYPVGDRSAAVMTGRHVVVVGAVITAELTVTGLWGNNHGCEADVRRPTKTRRRGPAEVKSARRDALSALGLAQMLPAELVSLAVAQHPFRGREDPVKV